MPALIAGLALPALGDGSSSPLFGGYFEDTQCSTAYATAASSHNLQTLAAAVKVISLTFATLLRNLAEDSTDADISHTGSWA